MQLRPLFLAASLLVLPAHAQRQALDPTAPATSRRSRLYLKDGSYQIVMSYKVTGDRVRFTSAERGGETEEIPLALVDLDATKRWDAKQNGAAATAIDPELAREEADRAALSPEVMPNLRLDPATSVFALDTFHGGPELVPLQQAESNLNKETGHGVLRSIIKPNSARHQIVTLTGEKSPVQIHVDDPAIYLRLDDAQASGGNAITVDTHGASAANTPRHKATEPNGYAIVRLDVRQDARVVASFNITNIGTAKQPQDVIDTDTTTLPGGHWLKIVPRQPLLTGEYALVEILAADAVNLGVWDFGIHPTAPENRDILRPEPRHPVTLDRRRPN